MATRALIAGATGIVGNNLAAHLISRGWEVHGIARKPQVGIPGVRPIAADLLAPESFRSSLAGIDPSHVFIAAWVRRATEEENIAVNGATATGDGILLPNPRSGSRSSERKFPIIVVDAA